MAAIYNPTVEDAIAIAMEAHRNQIDKQGQPYIFHILRVTLALRDPVSQMVAAFHDLIENTNWKIRDLQALGYSDEVLEAVDVITKRSHETYGEYIRRVANNPIAMVVKIADLHDNINRLSGLGETERNKLASRYEFALNYLNRIKYDPFSSRIPATPTT